jgi:hypothetical protein
VGASLTDRHGRVAVYPTGFREIVRPVLTSREAHLPVLRRERLTEVNVRGKARRLRARSKIAVAREVRAGLVHPTHQCVEGR